MRISDLSSDVCSSDLRGHRRRQWRFASCGRRGLADGALELIVVQLVPIDVCEAVEIPPGAFLFYQVRPPGREHPQLWHGDGDVQQSPELSSARACPSRRRASARRAPGRSAEHTSELPSLMRLSYAVLCLKKH